MGVGTGVGWVVGVGCVVGAGVGVGAAWSAASGIASHPTDISIAKTTARFIDHLLFFENVRFSIIWCPCAGWLLFIVLKWQMQPNAIRGTEEKKEEKALIPTP